MGRSGGREKKLSRQTVTRSAVIGTFFSGNIQDPDVVRVLERLDSRVYQKYREAVESGQSPSDTGFDTYRAALFARLVKNIYETPNSSPEADFFAQYQLLLAREILAENPYFKDLIFGDGGLLNENLRDLEKSGFKPEDINRFDQNCKELIAAIERSGGSPDQLIKAGQKSGLDISKLGPPFDEGSISVNGVEFMLFEGALIQGALKKGLAGGGSGVGDSFFQKQSSAQVIATLSGVKEIEEKLTGLPEDIIYRYIAHPFGEIDALKEFESGEDRETLDRAIKEIATVLDSVSENQLLNKNITSAIDGASSNSLSANALARITCSYAVGAYADTVYACDTVIKALDDVSPKTTDGQEKISAAKSDIGHLKNFINEKIGLDIDRVLGDESDKIRGVLPSSQIKINQFRDAKNSLSKAENINSNAVWSYMADSFRSDDPNDWLSEKGVSPLRTGIDQNISLIYGALAADQDPDIAPVVERCVENEDSLRLRARILGEIPQKELIYLPSNSWAGRDDAEGVEGVHLMTNKERPSIVFVSNSSSPERVAVHELIHSIQSSGHLDDDFKNIATNEGFSPDETSSIGREINEGLTEALAQVRTDHFLAEDTELDMLPPDTAYKTFVSAVLEIAKKAKVSQNDRELFLETMNSKSSVERIKILQKELGLKTPGAVLSLWNDLVDRD